MPVGSHLSAKSAGHVAAAALCRPSAHGPHLPSSSLLRAHMCGVDSSCIAILLLLLPTLCCPAVLAEGGAREHGADAHGVAHAGVCDPCNSCYRAGVGGARQRWHDACARLTMQHAHLADQGQASQHLAAAMRTLPLPVQLDHQRNRVLRINLLIRCGPAVVA